MPNCTICKGSGISSVTFYEDGKPPETTEFDCIYCKGSGHLSQEQIDQIEWEKEQWCKCDNPNADLFYDDRQHPECHKHHWRCSNCEKIVQIG